MRPHRLLAVASSAATLLGLIAVFPSPAVAAPTTKGTASDIR